MIKTPATHTVSAVVKTLIFTLLAPGTVAVYIPWLLRPHPTIPLAGTQKLSAVIVIALGAAIYLYTAFWSFALLGGGTPAPIAPTKTLVVKGLRRFVRNPMYIGVGLVIAGQAWLFRSLSLTIYLAFILLMFHLFVLVYEEPTLQKQFGEDYARYRRSVPRWIPKITP